MMNHLVICYICLYIIHILSCVSKPNIVEELLKTLYFCNGFMYDHNLETSYNLLLYLHNGMIASSTSLVHKDHSICTALIGWTAWALWIVPGLASDRQMYFIFLLPLAFSFQKPEFPNKATEKVIKILVLTVANFSSKFQTEKLPIHMSPRWKRTPIDY